MKLKTQYTLSFFPSAPKDLKIPLHIDLEGKNFKIEKIDTDGKSARAFIEGPINSETLHIKNGPKQISGAEPSKGIWCPEKDDFRIFLGKMVHILSFLIDTPIRYAQKLGGDVIVPENSKDERCLDDLGAKQVYVEFTTSLNARTFQISKVDDNELTKLADKEVGMALYSQALSDQDSVAKYRDFWKVLESAFGEKNDELINLLAQYNPAIDIGFTLDELKELLILRGRSSHAESKAGIEELRFIINKTREKLPRLKSLVEQVLITKKSWGLKSLGVERLAPLSAYVGQDGILSIITYTNNKRSD